MQKPREENKERGRRSGRKGGIRGFAERGVGSWRKSGTEDRRGEQFGGDATRREARRQRGENVNAEWKKESGWIGRRWESQRGESGENGGSLEKEKLHAILIQEWVSRLEADLINAHYARPRWNDTVLFEFLRDFFRADGSERRAIHAARLPITTWKLILRALFFLLLLLLLLLLFFSFLTTFLSCLN